MQQLLHLNHASGVPIHRQLEQQIRHLIAVGVVPAGQGLPSVRQLAAGLAINPNTVARVYRQLESEEVLRTVPGGGTFVADRARAALNGEVLGRIQPQARRLVRETLRLGLTREDLLAMIEREFASAAATQKSSPPDQGGTR